MKIKDNFFLGLLAGALCFGLFYFLFGLVPWENVMSTFGVSLNVTQVPLLLAFVPGFFLMRLLMVKLRYDKMGRGVLLISCIGMLLVFFLA